MNTLTFTHRYGVPAVLAALFHATLFLAITPGAREVVIALSPDLPTLRPFPPQIRETFAPPSEPGDVVQAIRPLSGGAPRPTGADRSEARRDGIGVVIDPVVVDRPRVPIAQIPTGPDGLGGVGTGVGGEMTPTIFSVEGLDRVPRALAQPAPVYPFALKQSGVEGDLVVEFEVDASGRVVTARVTKGGPREFEEAALQAVRGWRFEPGRRDGRVVPFRMAVPIGFRLSED